jgi:diadenosine tetraphosphate (Ap4A) HIT family hydrolase
MNNPKLCSFCQFISGAIDKTILFENATGFVVRDGFPITQGHTLIIPKQHIGSFFDISQSQRQDLFALVDLAKAELDQEYVPASYNIGINDGEAAGQTIPHLHIHLIPRYIEAGKDPRGGVRWLVPEKADYWTDRESTERESTERESTEREGSESQ